MRVDAWYLDAEGEDHRPRPFRGADFFTREPVGQLVDTKFVDDPPCARRACELRHVRAEVIVD